VDEMMTLARPDSLRFEPGKQFRYSNTGYLVLGKVIEVVEGRSYFDVVRDRIYKPLGMTSTDSYQLDQVNPNLAVGNTRAPGATGMELRNNIFEHVIRGGPAGGGYSNAADMLKYDEALRAGKLIKPETLALMRSPKPELGAKSYGYGFALFDGPEIWGHGGDFPGIDFDNNQYGDSGYVLIVLANYDRVNGPILRKMKGIL
jgi:CubicO group peptidase (beta-lactamase class C family)